jgi:hypothetical protein
MYKKSGTIVSSVYNVFEHIICFSLSLDAEKSPFIISWSGVNRSWHMTSMASTSLFTLPYQAVP